MKKSIVFVSIMLMILFSGCMPKTTPLPENQKQLQNVVMVNNESKQEIYRKVKMWIVENFVSAKSVIDYENPQQGIIVAKGNIQYPCSSTDTCMMVSNWHVSFMMKIEVKNNKMRITINHISIVTPMSEREVNSVENMKVIKPKLLQLVNDLTNYVKNPTSSNNW